MHLIKLSDIKENSAGFIGKIIDLTKITCDYFPDFSFSDTIDFGLFTKDDLCLAFLEKEIRDVCCKNGIKVIAVSKDILMQDSDFLDTVFDLENYLVLLK